MVVCMRVTCSRCLSPDVLLVEDAGVNFNVDCVDGGAGSGEGSAGLRYELQ